MSTTEKISRINPVTPTHVDTVHLGETSFTWFHSRTKFLFPERTVLIFSANTWAGSRLGAGASTGTVLSQSENVIRYHINDPF